MCTAITYQSNAHYFGRNLDLEYSLGESVVITPRAYPFIFRAERTLADHYAMIGMALIADGYPLYFDGTNEYGLSMAGLNFPGNAVYFSAKAGKKNISPFELIPWILSQAKDLSDAKKLLENVNLLDAAFSQEYQLSPLHWLLADKDASLVIESTKDGLEIYDNPVGVLTNNPPFEYHLYNLSNYMNVTCEEPVNRFAPTIDLQVYSRGMGGIGLPGDLSSASRFVRAVFTKMNSVSADTEQESVAQFFHILESVAQQDGCNKVGNRFEKTVYSSCCNLDEQIYYYTTYYNSQITAVTLSHENLDTKDLISFPLITDTQIRRMN